MTSCVKGVVQIQIFCNIAVGSAIKAYLGKYIKLKVLRMGFSNMIGGDNGGFGWVFAT